METKHYVGMVVAAGIGLVTGLLVQDAPLSPSDVPRVIRLEEPWLDEIVGTLVTVPQSMQNCGHYFYELPHQRDSVSFALQPDGLYRGVITPVAFATPKENLRLVLMGPGGGAPRIQSRYFGRVPFIEIQIPEETYKAAACLQAQGLSSPDDEDEE